MKRYELKKEQWDRIKQMLPPEETGKRERPHKDNRTMLNGMLWIVRSGAQWRELPEAYGPWQSVYARFAKWRDDGTLERVFHTLSGDEDMENLWCLFREYPRDAQHGSIVIRFEYGIRSRIIVHFL